ncbi:MAG: transglycosylase SLT domain-containing protein, partial [Oscillospiraceae bacterium]
QMNIMYGTYLISSLYKEFGNYETALAAYHAGRGKTKEWLNNSKYSSDQKTLHTIEYKETQQYVKKVMNTYKRYKNLYAR